MRDYLIRAPYTLLLAIGFAVVFLVAGCASTPPLEDIPSVSSEESSETAVLSSTADVVAKNAVVPQEKEARILAMGDSMMAWHSLTQKSVSHALENALGEPVASNAVSGARVLYKLPISGAMGMKIASQYRNGAWDWVVLNGGGNDLWLGCGCGKCTRKLNKLISEDGKRGAIPMLVQELRQKGAQVAWVGYLRSPGVWSPIESCRDNGEALEARIAKLAALDRGVHFVSLADLVPHGDRSFHSGDMIHPSLKGSREIGKRVAAVISTHDKVQ